MIISFQQVIPHPIKENYQAASDVWLKDVQFQKGQKYLITAPSGKGKSTFIHAIYGLRKDLDGTIQLNGKPTTSLELNDWATLRQANLSIVFQNLRLFPQLTGLENILLKNTLQEHFYGRENSRICAAVRRGKYLKSILRNNVLWSTSAHCDY